MGYGLGTRVARGVLGFAVVVASAVLSPSSTPPASAGATGGRIVDPALAFDAAQNRWLSIGSSEPLTAPGGSMCSPVDPVIQSRGWTNIPLRTGPTPDRMRGCWDGDLLRDPPSGWWAAHEQGSVRAPSLVKLSGTWWLAYSARKAGTQQRCIGVATSANPTGPWTHPSTPLVCPGDGANVNDPELYLNPGDGKLYVLWSLAVRSAGRDCSSQIRVQEVNMTTRTLVGSTSALMVDGSTPLLGFDEVADAQCPGGVRHVVENPTITRGANGFAWLFFSANDRNSRNYSEGFALCGTGAPGADGCALINVFDAAQDRYRPLWGDAGRTAPVGGVNAKPYFGFPDYWAGFGGLSLAVPDPSAPASTPQPTYATAQFWWSGDTHTVLAYRLDTGHLPALFETETVTIAGAPGTLGTVAADGTTQSGHSVATRDVAGMANPAGFNSVFDAMTYDGTVISASYEQNAAYGSTADDLVLGAYNPTRNTWKTIPVEWNRLSDKDQTGTGTLPPVDPADYGPEGLPWSSGSKLGAPANFDARLAGGSTGDVEAIDGGKAVMFTNPSGYPWSYAWLNGAGLPLPAGGDDGTWPAIGIVSQVDNEWVVASGNGWVNQWTGGQLAASVPRSPATPNEPSVSEKACPSTTGVMFAAPFTLPQGESWCGSPNELATLPASKDIVVAQYARNFGDDVAAGGVGGGLMVLRVTPMAGGRYDVKVRGWAPLPEMPTPWPTDDPDNVLQITAKSVHTDPTGVAGDERFVVDADVFVKNRVTGDFVDGHIGVRATMMELSYDESTGALRPTSAPLWATDLATGEHRSAVGGAYDSDGNLWVQAFIDNHEGRGYVGVYAKPAGGQRRISTAACGYDPAFAPEDYLHVNATTGLGEWGRVCQPDYSLPFTWDQVNFWPGLIEFRDDPATDTMVMVGTVWAQGLAVRRSGSGSSMTFSVGNRFNTGESRLSAPGGAGHRPGRFDATGRYFFSTASNASGERECAFGFPAGLAALCPGRAPYQTLPTWVTSIDVPQLFAPPAVRLPAATSEPAARVEAEQNATTATHQGSAQQGVVPINPDATTRMNSEGGYELVGALSSNVDYKVWAPTAGSYKLDYRICGSGVIRATIGSTNHTTTVLNCASSGGTTPGPTIQLAAGSQTIRLSRVSGDWSLDRFTLARR